MRTRPSDSRRAVLAAPPGTRSAGLVVIAIATTVLAAWIARATGWTALPDWIYRTNPMTAASLVLSGVVLLCPRAPRASIAGTLKLVVGCMICAIGVAKLGPLMIGQQRGVDLLLFPETVQSFNDNVLMAPSSALALVLLGGALVLSTRRSPQAPIVAQ